MTKFEYKVEEKYFLWLEEYLNKRGDEGWELVSCSPTKIYWNKLVWKRQREKDE